GDGDAGHQFTDHVGGGPVGRGAGQQAVRQHRYGQRLDVVGQDVVAAVQGGVGAGGAHQVQGGAGGGAQQQGRGGPGGRDQVRGVALGHGGDEDPADPLDHRVDHGVGGHRGEPIQGGAHRVRVDHVEFGAGVGVAHGDPGHEAVPL